MRRKIIVSKCLLEFPYRYDREDVRVPDLKEKLKEFEIITICPEVELLNLGVPRPRLKFISRGGKILLLKEDDGKEMGVELRKKSEEFINKLGEVHGAVLKSKSPSCGVADAKVYSCLNCEEEIGRVWGIFAEELRRKFPSISIITEKDIDLLPQVFKTKS